MPVKTVNRTGRILVKMFLTSKFGGAEFSQDQLCVNFSKGRFAVADGVTNSYHPEAMAKALCQAFVKGHIPVEQWPSQFREIVHRQVAGIWEEEVAAYEKTLSGRRLAQERNIREFLPAGASTLAGIAIDADKQAAYYQIIGDSTVFVFDREGRFQCFCTNEREQRPDGSEYVVYDNHPQCIVADGRMMGDWLSGEVALPNDGFIVLLTDAASEWLQEKSMGDPETVKRLWEIADAKAFSAFVDDCREREMKMNDDVAVIILKCESSARAKKLRYINMMKQR